MHNPVKAFTSRQCTTVNLEIFAVLFLRNFTNATFRENKTLAQWGNHTVVGDFLTSQICQGGICALFAISDDIVCALFRVTKCCIFNEL